MTTYVEFLPTEGISDVMHVEGRCPDGIKPLKEEGIFGFRFFDGNGEIRNGRFFGNQKNFSCRYLYGEKGTIYTMEELIQIMGRANTLIERMELLGCKAVFCVGNCHIFMEASDQVI